MAYSVRTFETKRALFLCALVLANLAPLKVAHAQFPAFDFVIVSQRVFLPAVQDKAMSNRPLRNSDFDYVATEVTGTQFTLNVRKKITGTDGQKLLFEAFIHSTSRPSADGKALEVNQKLYRLEASGNKTQVDSSSCWLTNQQNFQIMSDSVTAEFSGSCMTDYGASDQSQFRLYATKGLSYRGELEACMNEGIGLANDLRTARNELSKNQVALAQATAELAKTKQQLTSANASLTNTSRALGVARSYLEEIVATLKDNNIYYSGLRRKARDVLAALTKQ